HHPYERILEFRPDEFCGCASTGKLYADCCLEKDRSLNQLSAAVNFAFWSQGIRKPPEEIVAFVNGGETPDLAKLNGYGNKITSPQTRPKSSASRLDRGSK